MIRQSSALQCQSVPFSARTGATSPTTCVHRRVHGFTSYEALPQYRMWYLRFPTSLTGICSLERQAFAFLPGEHSFVRPRYIYLSKNGWSDPSGGSVKYMGALVPSGGSASCGTWAPRTRTSSPSTWTWSSPPTRRTEVSTNVINRPQPSGGYARANGYQEGPR